ncbi:amidohydrolase [uncultured Bilophila sp.]|uniref:amidohydrolase n=1 Tax=uncultured Bilophila sp. TaxID=529385 RepID=UPI00261465CB|nr:amidohydrolase [uncultured Bilophila sp.]
METASHIYRNGTILTMNSGGTRAEALAVRDGIILAAGSERQIMALAGKDTVITDLRGRTMLPGFIDGHSHFVSAGLMAATQLDLSSPPVGGVRNIAEIKELVRRKAAETPKGGWIIGFGYDDTGLEDKRHPLASDLDEVAPDHLVLLRHVSGHLSTCNSRALALANYTKDTPNPVGGVIRRDEHGNPNGVLEEPPAREPLFRHIPSPSDEDWMNGIKAACAAYTAKGVTSAQDGFTARDDWKALQEAHARGLLKNRVQILPGASRMDISQFNTHVSGTQLTADKKISLGAVKLLADGSLQCYTGYLSNPYHKVIYDLPGGADWRGYPMEHAYSFTDRVVELHRQGWQIAIHGNGDDAIQMILDAYEEAQKRYPRADARKIVIHCQTVREDQLDRIKRLGVVPSFFVVHTYFWGDRHYEIFLGPDRAERISPLRSAVRRGILFSNHNDTFVTPIDPLLSVWSAVNRRTSGGRTLGAGQTIPVMEALRSVTSWAAYQACEENIKGSLEAGKLADMVVLEENPLEVDPLTIKDIRVLATIVGDEIVYGSLD